MTVTPTRSYDDMDARVRSAPRVRAAIPARAIPDPHAIRRMPDLARALVPFFLDGFQLGFGGVAFLHHPVERLEEVVDARARGFGDPVPHDLVDLAGRLPFQQLLCIFLVETNHSVPSLQLAISMPMLRAVPITIRSAASTL